MAVMTSSITLSEQVDHLLERYLGLLDRYNNLQASLVKTHASVQQRLARANFEAPRGVRYGRDFYDSRMQASRFCGVTVDPEGTAGFTISTTSSHEAAEDRTTEQELERDIGAAEGEPSEKVTSEEEETKMSAGLKKGKDPIRMFGILTPQSLRMAQGDAINLVQEIVPRLLNIDAEMKQTEIQIRRAKKQRAKAEALEKRDNDTSSEAVSIQEADTSISVDALGDRISNIKV